MKKMKPQKYIKIEDPASLKKQEKYAKMCSGRDVLELGGVRGAFIDLAMSHGAKSVVSIDREPADRRVIKADIVKFIRTTKKRFDAIYARHMLEHFKPSDVLLIMKNAMRILRPDGIFIIVLPNLNNLYIAACEFWREFEHVRPYSDLGIRQNLENIGFEIIKREPDKDSWDSNPVKNFARFIRGIIIGMPCEAPDVCVVARKKAIRE